MNQKDGAPIPNGNSNDKIMNLIPTSDKKMTDCDAWAMVVLMQDQS